MTKRPVGRPPASLLGRSSAEWAVALGVDRRTVQRWIARRQTPPLATLQAIAAAAGVTLDDVAAALERHS